MSGAVRRTVVLEEAQWPSDSLAEAGSQEGPTHSCFRSVSLQDGFRVGGGVLTGEDLFHTPDSSKGFLGPLGLLVTLWTLWVQSCLWGVGVGQKLGWISPGSAVLPFPMRQLVSC